MDTTAFALWHWNAQPANDPSGPTLDWIEARQAAYAKSRNDDPDDRDVPF